MVEARKDTALILHPLTDDRRELPIEKPGEVLAAPPGFMLVVSYKPGYQHVFKNLKPSSRQRFVALTITRLLATQICGKTADSVRCSAAACRT